MSRISEEKRETLAFIDAIVTMLENSETSREKMPDIPSLSISVNPFDFLLAIINKFVSYEEMIDWLTNFITKSLPIVEIGVKGILLAKLKETIDCNNDPRIPEWIRVDPKNRQDDKGGIDMCLPCIDYKNILSVSPMSREGKSFYFGATQYYSIEGINEELNKKRFYTYEDAFNYAYENKINISTIKEKGEINNVYELVRAQDFNAFLWFVVNKARFSQIASMPGFDMFKYKNNLTSDGKTSQYYVGSVYTDDNDLHNLLLCTRVDSTLSNVDDVYYYSNPNNNQEVAEKQRVSEVLADKHFTYTFTPIGNINNGCNWYVNSGTYFQYLKSQSERVSRDYNKDKAICQITFKSAFRDSANYLGLPSNVINFKILPKPLIHIPTISYDETNNKINVNPPIRVLFDSDGNPDKNGKYSVISHTINNDGTYNKVDKSSLFECYPNLTVYEFNYDFVMGMQLFEPRVVTSQLIEEVSRLRYMSLNIKVDKTQAVYRKKISEIVKKIVESTEYTASDCFYSFSNEKYDSMLHESELKRSQLYEFNDSTTNNVQLNINEIFDLLEQFDDNATLNENEEVIKNTFLRASEILSSSSNNDEDKYNIQIGFVNNIISSLVTIIVETLLTPKIVLLLKVNNELLGESRDLNFEDFLNSLGGLITAIVKEVRDLILNEILNWAMVILKDLAMRLSALLLEEQIFYYTRLMKLLLKACSFKLNKRKPLDTQLDVVDYADIDEPTDQPVNNEC